MFVSFPKVLRFAVNLLCGVVEQLSSEGVDVNGANEQGQTALHLVCGLRYPSQQTLTIAEMLLRFGADVNAQDSGGNTPLHACATTSGAPSFISLLLAYGARPFVINSQGHTPLQSAALASNYDAMQTILQFTKSSEASKENRIQLPQRATNQAVDVQSQAIAVQSPWERYWTSEGFRTCTTSSPGSRNGTPTRQATRSRHRCTMEARLRMLDRQMVASAHSS